MNLLQRLIAKNYTIQIEAVPAGVRVRILYHGTLITAAIHAYLEDAIQTVWLNILQTEDIAT